MNKEWLKNTMATNPSLGSSALIVYLRPYDRQQNFLILDFKFQRNEKFQKFGNSKFFCRISQGSITETILSFRYLTLFSVVHGLSSKKNRRTVLETIEPILESIIVSLEK